MMVKFDDLQTPLDVQNCLVLLEILAGDFHCELDLSVEDFCDLIDDMRLGGETGAEFIFSEDGWEVIGDQDLGDENAEDLEGDN